MRGAGLALRRPNGPSVMMYGLPDRPLEHPPRPAANSNAGMNHAGLLASAGIRIRKALLLIFMNLLSLVPQSKRGGPSEIAVLHLAQVRYG